MATVKSTEHNATSDLLQVDLALEGNQQAYSILFNRHQHQLLFTVNKLIKDKDEAQDVTMEAFSKAFHNLHRFNKEYAFSTWLYRIALNHSISYVRKKRLPTTGLSVFVADDSAASRNEEGHQDGKNLNPEEQIIEAQRAHIIQRHLEDLPRNYRDIARMRFLEDCSYEEIGDSMALPVGTVKVRIHRARGMLKQSLSPILSFF
jgi:RNA polymerase sigma-70 factor (ECF subfamily)